MEKERPLASVTVTGKAVLTTKELEEIAQLEQICNDRDGLRMKLNWELLKSRTPGVINDYLCYLDGQLAGFAGLYSFDQAEVEVSGMVHPALRRQGIGRRLLLTALGNCRRREADRMLIICERPSKAGKLLAEKAGGSYTFSEYGMERSAAAHSCEPGDSRMQYRFAGREDREAIANLDRVCFGGAEDAADLDASWMYDGVVLGILAGEIIGKVKLSGSEGPSFISGLCLLPAYQGQGLGRELLAHAVAVLRDRAPEVPIALEVACLNERALGLYQRCGFAVTTAYDYYTVTVADHKEPAEA